LAAFGFGAAFGGAIGAGGAAGALTGVCATASAAVALRRNRGASDGLATVSGTDVDAAGALVGGVTSVGGVGGLRRAMIGADSRGPTPGSVAAGT
jgi:hypothetical protein